jgi:hypothetical protein
MEKKLSALLLLLLSITLGACSKKAQIGYGITETLPDEYKVQKVAPLEVPPHYNNAHTKSE